MIARADHPFLVPTLEWEKNGNVPNVIFLEGAVPKSSAGTNHNLEFIGYYGAADKFIGAAEIRITVPR